MDKETRLKVYEKYGGHCAYCGKNIKYKDMQVDHIVPIFRNCSYKCIEGSGIVRGEDNIDNYNPSCRSCNFRKSTLSVEQFRNELKAQCEGIIKRSFQVRQSIDYGLLIPTNAEIVFYFEKYKDN